MYKLFIALRYLRANKVIYFSIAGVGLGIAVMIIVTSVMGGFSRDIQARIRGLQAHLVVKPMHPDILIGDYDRLVGDIRALPHVAGAAPRIEYAAWLSRGGSPRSVVVIGIDPKREAETSELPRFFERGGQPWGFDAPGGEPQEHPGVVVGCEVYPFAGSSVFLQTVRNADGPMYMRGEFVIAGHFKSGMAEYDSEYLFMDLTAMQDFMKLAPPHLATPVVNTIAVRVDDYDAYGPAVRARVVEAVHARYPCRNPDDHVAGICGRFRVQTWQEVRSILLQAVAIERGIQVIILFCIVIVAGFNIIAIYTMMVRAKTRDVGILRSLGATRRGVTSIFLLSGGLCGLFGSIFGIALGALIATYLNEIVAFVRITSRELNRAAWAGPEPSRAATVMAEALFLLAFAALLGSWRGLYGPFAPRAWAWAGLAALFALAGSAIFYSWTPEYKPLMDDDPALPRHFGWAVGGTAAALLVGWAALRRGTERWREILPGGFIRVAGTVLYSGLTVFFAGAAAVCAGLLTTQPQRFFGGWDLFPRQVYYLDRVPVLIDAWTVGLIVLATLGVSLVFSIYPALRAASYDPIEAIRDEA